METFHVGKIVNTHGLRGEVKVVPITDSPETRFKRGSQLVIIHQGQSIPVTVATSKWFKGMYLLTFEQLGDINLVEKYKGDDLDVAADQREDLADGVYYYDDIIGLTVVTTEGETVGQVSEILSPGPNDVWVIPRPGKSDALIPFLNSVVLSIDLDAKKATIDLPEGLINDAD